ncbi:transposase [Methanobrevibacter sp.]|uniref:transposase n=1 Tax=Methanobrevibacter sp. TaxID=66852 RepID=UPI00386FCBD7
MKHRLNLDIKDPNYTLLKEIFKIMDSRKSSQILASYGFKNLNKQITTFKIIFISMFFGLDIPFILNELESKKELQKYFNISEILTADQIYKNLSLQDSEKLLKALNRILNHQNRVKRRGKKTFIVDATPIDLDFNFKRNKKTKEHLKTLNLKWSYSSSKGFYIGFKATVILDYDSMNPVSILIHSGAPNDAKLFDEIMENLQKRRIIQKGDMLIFDKGYYSYKNYQLGISKYKIVPFIFPKDNFKRTKLNDQLSYPLQVFKKTKKILAQKQFYNNLKHELLKKLDNWKKFKPIRGKIEDFFKLLKQGLNLREIHKYTPKSVAKTVYLNVFLGALIISQGFYSKTAIQQLSEN